MARPLSLLRHAARHASGAAYDAASWFVVPPETKDVDWDARMAELHRLAARDARVESWFYALVLAALFLTFGVPLIAAALR